jgi:hypothetical protein
VAPPEDKRGFGEEVFPAGHKSSRIRFKKSNICTYKNPAIRGYLKVTVAVASTRGRKWHYCFIKENNIHG